PSNHSSSLYSIPVIQFLSFSISCYRDHRNLHSFPTRRSSDLAFRDSLPQAESIDGIRLIEARAAAAYWTAWHDVPILYPRKDVRSEEHTSELQSHLNLVCRLLLEKKNVSAKCHTRHLHTRTPI